MPKVNLEKNCEFDRIVIFYLRNVDSEKNVILFENVNLIEMRILKGM